MKTKIIQFPHSDRPVIPDIVFRHLEDAAFFWSQRDSIIGQRSTPWNNVQRLDKKILAHIRGIQAAGETGWQLALTGFEREEAEGEMFAATIAALALPDNETCLQILLDKLPDAPHLKRAFLAGCAWSHSNHVIPVLQRFFHSPSIQLHDIAITICGLKRMDPDEFMLSVLSRDNCFLKIRALQAIGESGFYQYQSHLSSSLNHENQAQKFWAARSLVLLGDREKALHILCDTAKESGHPFQEAALQLVLRALPFNQACHLLNQIFQQTPPQVILPACGDFGATGSMNWIIEQMHKPELAQIAGETFTCITGVDLKQHNLHIRPAEENIEADDEEHNILPLPDADKVKQWWQSHQKDFKPDLRYVSGQILNEESLLNQLGNGTQAMRSGAALDLMLSGYHNVLFNIESPYKI